MKKQAEDLLRSRCKFEVSLRYDLFYSLGVLLDPNSRIHPNWRRTSLKMLGHEFNQLVAEIGGSWEIWPVLASTLPGPLSSPKIEELITALREIPAGKFQEKILRGLIHSDEAVSALLKRQTTLKSALSKIPKQKREWISHIGLYPYDPDSPQVIALEKLLADSGRFKDRILRILEIYWQRVFSATWERIQPQLKRNLQERERLFYSCSFAEFSKQALLRIEINETRSEIHALRGGYRLRFQDVEACYLMPSAFNDRRFWSAFRDEGKKMTVYFPYFDPSVALDLIIAGEGVRMTDPALDPALIFKSLGDATRFAIATILARTPTSSVELAKILEVSKPTISHHIQQLREAGLIQETYVNGSVELRLKRSVLERLSELAVAKLFDTDEPISLIRTRGGAVT